MTSSQTLNLIDTHTHLQFPDFDHDLAAVLGRARAAGVRAFICVGTDLVSSEGAIALARAEPNVVASVGIHPHQASACNASALDRLRALATEHDPVVALGETGLDFYRNRSPRDAQEAAFRAQIRLAKELVLPLIIHVRDAWDAVLDVLEDEGAGEVGGVLHCFSGTAAHAERGAALGFHLGIGGVVTFKNAGLGEMIGDLPHDRLLLETDCPYLAPHPHRGRRSEPAHIRLVAERVTLALGGDLEAVAAQASAGALRLFGPSLSAKTPR